ncbi:MAG: hypothetical protein JWN86_1547 [Planctomycetota bacterium]|nr:hypothetical protein [Planctomycetota bacterium]
MKQTFAAVILLAALGVFCKLAWKAPSRPPVAVETSGDAITRPTEVDASASIRARYPVGKDRDLVEKTLKKYAQTAIAIEKTDGLRGLALLDRLDLEAIYLYEKHPKDFRRLRDSLTDAAAADLLLHWGQYFGMKRADDTDRAVLVEEIARLTSSQKKWASKYPNALPLILADPVGVTALIERLAEDPGELADALVVLDLVSLEHGTADLRTALRTLDAHGPLALDAFRRLGAEGFALVTLYGAVLDALGNDMPLDQALIALRVNTDYVDDLLATSPPEAVARHLAHVSAVGLAEAVGGHPQALRLVVEFGDVGERALKAAGPDAADVVFHSYADSALRNQAVAALAEHGTMALAMLDKYAPDPDFREILRHYGPAVIPPVARSDASPEMLAMLRAKAKKSFKESLAQGVYALSGENGQATIRQIKADGLDRVADLNSTEIKFYQFLPLYDLLHLGSVVGRGQSPTSGEMAWALLDGCFVIADVLSLTALQPEGAAAVEAARSELKAVAREGVKTAGRDAAEDAALAASRSLARDGVATATARASRWWAVRSAGGAYALLRRTPEALSQMPLPQITLMARAFCSKAGLRLSEFAPRRFLLRSGAERLLSIPPEKGLKYLSAQMVQAGVGVVAIHKMEEHLASRRPQSQ